MGITLDQLNGRIEQYTTCDRCGLPILGEPHVEPPSGVRDWDRYSHAGPCPDDDDPDDERQS
jgi:hypothetical protein